MCGLQHRNLKLFVVSVEMVAVIVVAVKTIEITVWVSDFSYKVSSCYNGSCFMGSCKECFLKSL